MNVINLNPLITKLISVNFITNKQMHNMYIIIYYIYLINILFKLLIKMKIVNKTKKQIPLKFIHF